MSGYLPPFHVGPVSIRRARCSLSPADLERVVNLTWEVAGHAPIDRVKVRFDRAGSFYHAKEGGFPMGRRAFEKERNRDAACEALGSILGVSTCECPKCRARGGIHLDVFPIDGLGDVTPEEARRQNVNTLAHELAHAGDLRLLAAPGGLADISLPQLNAPIEHTEEDKECEVYAQAVADEVTKRFFGEGGP